METNYTDKIRELQTELEKRQKRIQQEKNRNAVSTVEKSELETLFVSCIEHVRKEIIKRRLKAEVQARKKSQKHNLSISSHSISNNDIQQMEFEETLNKLADLAKGRVKFEEFTQQDSVRLLDLFVNNEQTLLKMYEFLFPHQQSFKAKQALKNPSDMIRLNETSQMGLPFNETLTEATGIGLSLNQS